MLRIILSVIAGVVIGSIVNMTIIMIGSHLIPAPDGVDVSDMESIAQSMHLYQPIHFLPPFLAHAIGTLVGALVAFKFNQSRTIITPVLVAIFFLLGGILSSFMLPAPLWFIAIDLIFAYLPMAWLVVIGYRAAK